LDQHCCSHELFLFFSFFFPLAALCCSPSGCRLPFSLYVAATPFSGDFYHVSRKIHVFEFQSKCVDTTGIVFKLGFWDSDLVSTPQGTVSTPQILEDLERVGLYAWGAAFQAHTFADLSSSIGRETTVGGFAPYLQVWSYYYIPLGRAIEVRPDVLPLARRWLPMVTAVSLSLQLDTLRRNIQDFPALLVWSEEVEMRGIGRRTWGKAKKVDWHLRFPGQYANWWRGGILVESDAADNFAYL
ncbi:hypothetical protein Taro_043020, partial [Colocasia esculenta]|nr:hypothetical protein [Colocasia esculenta]